MSQQWGLLFSYNVAVDVPLDPDPNVTPPAAGRVFRQKAQPGGSVGMAHALTVFVGSGTSLAVEYWVKEDKPSGVWWKVGVATVTAAAGSVAFPAIPLAQTFIRVTTNTGAVQKYGVAQS